MSDEGFDLIIPPGSGGGGGSPTGPAGGSLAGNYPSPQLAGRDSSVDELNKDLLPALLADPNGVTTIPAASTAAVDLRDFQHEWLGELATGVQTLPVVVGGSLSGTLPNPGFAGRDASVDKLNQDLLPGLLTGEAGVQQIPVATSGGSVATDAIWDTKGDIAVATGADAAVKLPAGALGTTAIALASETAGLIYGNPQSLQDKYKVVGTPPAYETYPRWVGPVNGAIATTGVVLLAAVALPKGFTVTSISWFSATTPAGTPTHWWFSLCDSSFITKRSTADQLTAAWAANTEKKINLSSTFVTTYEGLYYLALMMTATTQISVPRLAQIGGMQSPTPRLVLSGITGQTTAPADGTNLATSPADFAGIPYAYCS